MNIIMYILSVLMFLMGAHLIYNYLSTGADRTAASTGPIYFVAAITCILQGNSIINQPTQLSELMTVFTMFSIPFVLLKNHILFYERQFSSKSWRCFYFNILMISFACIMFYIFSQTSFHIDQYTSNITAIINSSIDNKVFRVLNGYAVFLSIILLISSKLSGRKLKTMLITGFYTIMMMILFASSFLSDFDIIASYIIYILSVLSAFLILWRNYNNIIIDSRKISLLYQDVKKFIKRLSKKFNERDFNMILDILRKDDRLQAYLLHEFCLSPKVRKLKQNIIENLKSPFEKTK